MSVLQNKLVLCDLFNLQSISVSIHVYVALHVYVAMACLFFVACACCYICVSRYTCVYVNLHTPRKSFTKHYLFLL